MMWNKYMWGSEGFGFSSPLWGFLFPLMILDVVLKGFSLWRAARNKQNIWFIALLLVNSLGILPAIYLLTHKQKKASK